MRPSLGQQQRSGRGRQGGEVHRAGHKRGRRAAASLGDGALAGRGRACAIVRWLWGVPSGDVAALSSEVVGGFAAAATAVEPLAWGAASACRRLSAICGERARIAGSFGVTKGCRSSRYLFQLVAAKQDGGSLSFRALILKGF